MEIKNDQEIVQLYNQIIQYSNQIDNLVKHATVIVGGLLAVAFTIRELPGSIIALLSLIVLPPLHLHVLNRKINLVRIATYIQNFSGPNWQYEKKLHLFRNDEPKDKINTIWQSYEVSTNSMFIAYGIISIICSGVLAAHDNYIFIILPIIGAIIWGVYVKRKWEIMRDGGMGGNIESLCNQRWKKFSS
jgi:hypothetical protein